MTGLHSEDRDVREMYATCTSLGKIVENLGKIRGTTNAFLGEDMRM